MLRMVLKNGDKIKLGEDIIIKSMSEGRVELAIDAPREVKIDRIEADKPEQKNVSMTSTNPSCKK